MLGLVLYYFESDDPYDHVMLVKLARLACLGLHRVSTTLLLFACHCQLQFGGFIDGPVTQTSGWAVGFGQRPWR